MKMRPTPDSRKRIRPDEKLQFTLDGGERELILQHTFADDDLTRRLRVVPRPGGGGEPCEGQEIKEGLNCLFDRIQTILESYTDEDD